MEAMDPFIDDLPIKILIFQFALVVYHSLYQEKKPSSATSSGAGCLSMWRFFCFLPHTRLGRLFFQHGLYQERRKHSEMW
jgi:hypothetical protein